MKMLKNGLEVDASATSRIPIPSPPSTKRVDVLRCAARPPVRPVHDPPDHLAEDGAVAVAAAVAVDGVAALREQKKGYKNRGLPAMVPNVWSLWTRDGSETQTHDSTSTTPRQTTTACESSRGCRGQYAPRDSQSWVWDHQSHWGSSNQTCHRHWRKTSTRSGLRQTEKICGGIV